MKVERVTERTRTRRQKWLLIARLLDALEDDFHAIYPDEAPPIEDGYEASIRRLIGNMD